jgi:hypothetical protein
MLFLFGDTRKPRDGVSRLALAPGTSSPLAWASPAGTALSTITAYGVRFHRLQIDDLGHHPTCASSPLPEAAEVLRT